MISKSGSIGRKGAKAALLLSIYLLHFFSFQYLKASTQTGANGLQKITVTHTSGAKTPGEKKPYSSFIVNHVVTNQKQHNDSDTSVQIHTSLKNIPVIPQVVIGQAVPVAFHFSTGDNKRFKFLHTYLI